MRLAPFSPIPTFFPRRDGLVYLAEGADTDAGYLKKVFVAKAINVFNTQHARPE